MPTCTVVIQDEVNVKITGLDLDTRKSLVRKFKYEDPTARYRPAYKLGRWDGSVSFFGLGGTTYLYLIPLILEELENRNFHIEVEDLRTSPALEFDKIAVDFWGDNTWPAGHRFAGQPIRLREDQVEVINKFLENPQCIQEIATGFGKCQPLSSKVLTTNGWKQMGEITKNDKVITPDGTPANIINIYNPGKKDVYEIKFADGRTARACNDHIWKVHNIDWKRSKTGAWRNISTADIIKQLSTSSRAIKIPLPSFVNEVTPECNLPIDPWLLGFLLGDGSFRKSLEFSTADSEILEKIRSLLPDNLIIKHLVNYDYAIVFKDEAGRRSAHSALIKGKERDSNGQIVKSLRKSSNSILNEVINLGLMHKYSYEKFIPQIYFNGSYQQRLALIQGLVDSDGSVEGKNITFSTTSPQLAKDFQYLIRSIGGIARISTKENNTYVYNGERRPCRDAYIVSTRFRDPSMLVSLSRKREKTVNYQYSDCLNLAIKQVTKVSYEDVRCIEIDHPDHLYLTDDFIVTHNTITTATLSKICEKYGRTITIVPNKSLVEQTEEDFINCGLDVGVYYGDRKELGKTHTICTWQSLNILDKKNKEDSDLLSLAEFLDGVNTVMVDEVHMAKADVLKKLLTQNICHAPIRWGLTGTVPKADIDFLNIKVSLGEVVHEVKAHELQEQGVLSSCHVNIIQTEEWKEFSGYAEELKYLVTNKERMECVAKLIGDISKTGNTLVLVDRIECGKFLQTQLSSLMSLLGEKPDVAFISGNVKSKDRKEEYDEVRTSNDKIIIATYGVAAVGINIPRIFNLVLIEPGKSFVRVIQSIGRGIRKADDKDFVNIFDITANTKYAKRHLTERKRYYKEAKYPFTIKKIKYNM